MPLYNEENQTKRKSLMAGSENQRFLEEGRIEVKDRLARSSLFNPESFTKDLTDDDYIKLGKERIDKQTTSWGMAIPRAVGTIPLRIGEAAFGGAQRIGESWEKERQEIKDAIGLVQREGAPIPQPEREMPPIEAGKGFGTFLRSLAGRGVKEVGRGVRAIRETAPVKLAKEHIAKSRLDEARIYKEVSPEVAELFKKGDEESLVKASQLLQSEKHFAQKSFAEKVLSKRISKIGEAASKYFRETAEELRPVTEPGTLKYYATTAIESVGSTMGPALIATLATKKPGIGLTIMFPQVYGQSYSEQRSEGKSVTESTDTALMYAITEVLSEGVPLGVITKVGGKFVPRVLKGATAESIQEGLNEAVQIAYDEGIIGKDTPSEEIGQRLLDAGIIGAIGGTGMGVISHGVAREETTDEEVTTAKKDVMEVITDALNTKEQTPEQALNSIREGYESGLFDKSDLDKIAKQYPNLKQGMSEIIETAANQQAATNVHDIINEGMAEGNIMGEPFTTDTAFEIINTAYADKIITDEDIDLFKEQYPDLRPGLNDIIGKGVGESISQEIEDAERIRREVEEASIKERADREAEGRIRVRRVKEGRLEAEKREAAKIERKEILERKIEKPEKPIEPVEPKPKEPEIEKPKVAEKEPWEMARDELDARYEDVTKEDLTSEQIAQVEKQYAKETGDKPEKAFDFADYQLDKETGEVIPSLGVHSVIVKHAIEAGKTIPKEVLAEYPDLAPAKPPTPKPAKPTPPEAVEKEIKAEPIPEVAPKVEKIEKVEISPKKVPATIKERQKIVEEKYSPVFGTKIETPDGVTWELKSVNDLGVPYFSKVIKGKVQKKEFTVSGFEKEWLDGQIKKEPKVEAPVKKVPTKPEPGKAWIKGKQRTIMAAREITRGKNKGKYEITLTRGRDAEGNIIPGIKRVVEKKAIITMPEAIPPKEEKVFAAKTIKPQDTITRKDLQSIFGKMKNLRTGVNQAGNFYFKAEGKPAVEILEVDHISGFIQVQKGTDKERIPVGSYLRDTIELKTGGKGFTADINTAWHEFHHYLEKNGIVTPNDIKALDSAIGKIEVTEEDRATYVGDNLADWKTQTNTRIKRILKKISDFANAVYEFFSRTRTAKGVLRDIETGKILAEKKEALVGVPTTVPAYQQTAERFYSQVTKTVEDKMPAKMQASAVIPWLKKQSGIKPAELEWMGVEEMLEGKKVVGKDELAGLLRENEIWIKEVERRVFDSALKQDRITIVENIKKFFTERLEEDEKVRVDPELSEYIESGKQPIFTESILADYAMTLEDNFVRAETPDPKFAQYQIPGEKENYRELLFTLPSKGVKEPETTGEYAQLLFGKSFNELREDQKDKVIHQIRVDDASIKRKKQFRSPHWDEPNVFAHVRTNERTDADGNRILFIEEIQSDWEQSIRKGERIPDMPFKKNWHEVVLKRMVRQAAEQGFDKVAWITGAQTADRYDLSKQISQITYQKDTDGNYTVFAYPHEGDHIEKAGLNQSGIAEFIGKEIAEKIVGSGKESGKLFGLDLKVGGEWAYHLYDKMIPQYLKKFGKKYGAEVGMTEINDQKQQSFTITPELKRAALFEGMPLFQTKPKRDYRELIKRYAEEKAKKAAETTQTTTKSSTGQKLTDELEKDRTYANKMHEERDEALFNVDRHASALERQVKALTKTGKKRGIVGRALSAEEMKFQEIEARKLAKAMFYYRESQINPEKGKAFEKYAIQELKTARGEKKIRLKEQIETYRQSQMLTNDQKKFVDVIIDTAFGAVGKKAIDAGIITKTIDNYVRRIIKVPDSWAGSGKYGFKTFTTASMKRKAETIFDHFMEDRELKVSSIVNAYSEIASEVAVIVANKNFIKASMDIGVFTTDARKNGYAPLNAQGFSAWSRKAGVKIKTTPEEPGFLQIDAHGRKIFFTPPSIKYGATEIETDRVAKYFETIEDAQNWVQEKGIDKYVVEKIQQADVFEKVTLHAPERIAMMLNRMTRTGSGIFEAPLTSGLLRFNFALKAWILLSSFFHHMAGQRSWSFGVDHEIISALKSGNIKQAVKNIGNMVDSVSAHKRGLEKIKAGNPSLSLLVKHGLTLGRMQDWDESLMREQGGVTETIARKLGAEKLVKGIEAMRVKRETFTNSLFKRYFAGLKSEAAVIEFNLHVKKAIQRGETPNTDLIAEQTARLINADFGGLHLARMGRSKDMQNMLRLLLLAPDWTESNFRTFTGMIPGANKVINRLISDMPGPPGMGKVYRGFWGGVIIKATLATILAQAAASLWDDEEDKDWRKEEFLKNFKRLKWTGVNVSGIYREMGIELEPNQRKIFSVVGHFADPLKIVHPEKLIKGKGSPLTRIAGSFMTKTDWRERPYTSFGELVTTRKLKKKSRYEFKENFWEALPSIATDQVINMQPIQVGYLLRYLQGEEDGLSAGLSSMGFHVTTAYKPSDKYEFADRRKKIRAKYQRYIDKGKKSEDHAKIRKLILNYNSDRNKLKERKDIPTIGYDYLERYRRELD